MGGRVNVCVWGVNVCVWGGGGRVNGPKERERVDRSEGEEKKRRK